MRIIESFDEYLKTNQLLKEKIIDVIYDEVSVEKVGGHDEFSFDLEIPGNYIKNCIDPILEIFNLKSLVTMRDRIGIENILFLELYPDYQEIKLNVDSVINASNEVFDFIKNDIMVRQAKKAMINLNK
jgi:hypothetical protein